VGFKSEGRIAGSQLPSKLPITWVAGQKLPYLRHLDQRRKIAGNASRLGSKLEFEPQRHVPGIEIQPHLDRNWVAGGLQAGSNSPVKDRISSGGPLPNPVKIPHVLETTPRISKAEVG
jgi:hypothetical protein